MTGPGMLAFNQPPSQLSLQPLLVSLCLAGVRVYSTLLKVFNLKVTCLVSPFVFTVVYDFDKKLRYRRETARQLRIPRLAS